MRQDPNRHTLFAYFPSRAQAEKAKQALEGEGFKELQIDRVSRYGTESASILTNPITGNFTSLANLTLGSQDAGEDEGALMAADPTASGLAEGVGVREKGYLLAIVTRNDRVNQAREIAEREGGEV